MVAAKTINVTEIYINIQVTNLYKYRLLGADNQLLPESGLYSNWIVSHLSMPHRVWASAMWLNQNSLLWVCFHTSYHRSMSVYSNQSINQSFYCNKAWQNTHLHKKNTVKRQWTKDNSYAQDINTRRILCRNNG